MSVTREVGDERGRWLAAAVRSKHNISAIKRGTVNRLRQISLKSEVPHHMVLPRNFILVYFMFGGEVTSTGCGLVVARWPHLVARLLVARWLVVASLPGGEMTGYQWDTSKKPPSLVYFAEISTTQLGEPCNGWFNQLGPIYFPFFVFISLSINVTRSVTNLKLQVHRIYGLRTPTPIILRKSGGLHNLARSQRYSTLLSWICSWPLISLLRVTAK